ncbi:MAG TPA: hypothetical protein PK625_02555 [Spirochaetales bacterium]|nr:hypothetical protein [Spirochaetales bacterium]
MRKYALVAVLLALVAAPAAMAQFRVDVGFDAPMYVGLSSFGETSTGESIAVPSFIPLPFAQGSFQLDLGIIKAGIGIKAYTLIIESLGWPVLWAEMDFDPIVLNLTVGGGAFLYFGALGNGMLDVHFIIPDLSAMFKLGRFTRLGLGVMTFVGSETQDVFPFIAYGAIHFSFPL